MLNNLPTRRRNILIEKPTSRIYRAELIKLQVSQAEAYISVISQKSLQLFSRIEHRHLAPVRKCFSWKRSLHAVRSSHWKLHACRKDALAYFRSRYRSISITTLRRNARDVFLSDFPHKILAFCIGGVHREK